MARRPRAPVFRASASLAISCRAPSSNSSSQPSISNILRYCRTMAFLGSGRSETEIADEIGMGGSGQLKKYVTEAVNGYFEPIRERRHRFESDLDYVKDVLHEGNRRANEIAEATLAEVREAMGMVY